MTEAGVNSIPDRVGPELPRPADPGAADLVVSAPGSAEATLVAEMLSRAATSRQMSIAERRKSYEQAANDLGAAAFGPDRVRTEVPAGIWTRPIRGVRPVVVYLHGGSYCLGSARSHLHLADFLAEQADAACFVLDYRRAPEDPFPAALVDAVAAVESVRAIAGPGPVVLAGDSAGAGLAIAVAVALRERGLAAPAGLVAMSPWVDLTCTAESHRLLATQDPVLETNDLASMAVRYAGTADLRHPEVSPVFADLTGLPPILVQVGGREILLDEARTLVRKVRAGGGVAVLQEWPHLFHVWQWYHPILPEGQHAIRLAADFIRGVAP
ncbi:MAG: alpha/beta hydrolase [Nocardioides sp.]